MRTSIIIFLLVFVSCFAFASDYEALESCESFFISLKSRDYGKVWNLLSDKSKKTIVDDVYSEMKKTGEKVELSDVRIDFGSCSYLCKTYWDSFLERFNPDFALSDSEWSLGEQKKNYAEIILKYKNSSNPAVLKMYRENGAWRFGFTETFWTRKLFM